MKLSARLLCLEFDQLESKKTKLREIMFQTDVWKYLKFDVQLYSVDFNFLKVFEQLYSFKAVLNIQYKQ